MPPLPVSVCTLCLNEAAQLPRCLDQRLHFAEWIVLDTGSSDDSPRIAAGLGARVEHGPWTGFSETRRRHFALATQPWIFWIDADETITPELVEELRSLFAGGGDLPCAAYEVNRMMFFEGRWIRHGDWFPDRVTRLFRRESWSLEARSVHESVTITGSTGRLRAVLPHYSYKDWNDRRDRIRRYARLWAEQHAANQPRPGPLAPPLHAAWRFLRGYLLKRGCLDRGPGLKIALSNAEEAYLKYQELRRRTS